MRNLLLYKPVLNPFLRLMTQNIGEYSGTNIVTREVPIIVSLTSYEEHFRGLELTLYSLLNQTVQPDRIILWLSDEYELSELPYSITRYIKNGLEIRFVEDKFVYNKIIYPLKEYGNSINVVADDDIVYPKNWLEKLYHSYIANPENIHLHRALGVNIKDSQLASIKEWEFGVNLETAEYSNFINTEAGVLFPPNCFSKEIFREDIYKKFSSTSPEAWLWFMALVSGRKIRVVKNHIKILSCVNYINKLVSVNSEKYLKRTDEQIGNLMEFYRQNIMQKLKA